MTTRQVPPYFEPLIERFRRGEMGRFVHLGHWDEPPPLEADPRPGEFEQAQARLNEVLLEMAGLREGQRVLDAGCGFGGTLECINARHSAMQLAGLNVDRAQLEICQSLQARAGNALHWVEGDAGALPFHPATFDRVLCLEAMFHFASRQAFYREAARVLRPGGVLVVADMAILPSAVPGFMIEALLRDGYGPWPHPWETEADHETAAAKAGLRLTERRDATAHTLPSHRFTVPPFADERHDPEDAALRSGLTLRWLHRVGHLRYFYLRFEKVAA